VIWDLVFTKQAQKDARKLAFSNLRDKAQALLDVIQVNPFHNPPPYEKLIGDLEGAYSRRINIQHGGNAELGKNSTLTISSVRKGSMTCDRICQ
jgi:toxin YoeB